ncbi:MAG: extracellular solute-binding protein [Planctomycetota bacterium]|jgi:molybdate/tungstate transport system substrate-binding protein
MNKSSNYILFGVSAVIVLVAVIIYYVNSAAKPSLAGRSKLIVFHAGSLAVPFREICEEFSKENPQVQVIREAAGSRACARKISDIGKPCDVMASADYKVIDTLLIGEHADWNIKFASNEIVIVFEKESKLGSKIDKDNWYELLMQSDVSFGRSDPNLDPCGYRTVIAIELAAKFYKRFGLAGGLLAKDAKYIRPKEVDLLALLEVGELDFVFIYRSVARQHGLGFLELPDEINLGNAEFADVYETASVCISGKKPGTFITRKGAPILYGVTIPKAAPNRENALLFVEFLLDRDKGGAILERNGQGFTVPLPSETFDKLPGRLRGYALSTGQERSE